MKWEAIESGLSWVERVTVRSVVHHQSLAGATSSEIHRIGLNDGSVVVLRLFTNREWLAMEPDLAEHEAAALAAVAMLPLSCPELLAFDPTGAQAGAPALLMTEVPGSVVLRPPDPESWRDGLAEALATIHEIEVADFPWAYRIWQDLDRLAAPAWSQYPDMWRQVIDVTRRESPSGPTGFIHRDFHPTNVLWLAGSVSGVVDWVNACLGPKGVDVAHCRLNLAAMYGVAVADEFATRYGAYTGLQFDPRWDLRAVVEWLPECEVYPPWLELGLPDLDSATVRTRLEEFAATALTRLS